MTAAERVASPVLVGRDELLALAGRRLDEAAGGHGHLLFVAGEAGIGKTRLLSSISRRAGSAGFAVLRAAAFRGDADNSGGVLLDLAGDLRRDPGVRMQAAGRTIAERLRDPLAAGGDQHRMRRLLVQDLADAVLDLDADRRILLVLEDLHWADQLSIEVVGHLAARLADRRTLILGAYRSDELFPGTPMRDLRSGLLTQRLAEEIKLPRLTLAQTGTLAATLLGHTAPTPWLTALHESSDGIPLHIEELVSASGGAEVLRFPDTLADAVLVRAARLDADARDVAGAAAVIGRSFDFDLLTAVSQRDAEDVDRCLRLLQSVYLVEAGADEVSFDFRHALIRDALYADVSLPRRRELHERVARAAVNRSDNAAFVSAHFEQAGLASLAFGPARAGALAATGVSAHRVALALYRRALRTMPADISVDDHAQLLAALGNEAAALDDNADAAAALGAAHELWSSSGALLSAAAVTPALVSVRHLLGDDLDARVAALTAALQSIDAVAGAEQVRARLFGSLAAAYMLDRRLDESIHFGELSRALSDAAGDEQADRNLEATLGSVLLFAGRTEPGWELLTDAVSRATRGFQESEAARGYRMGGSSASVLVDYAQAKSWLTQGIRYAGDAELWNHRSYMTSHLAHVQWATGEWDAAQHTAELALADGRGGVTTRITALYVLGYLAMGRGAWTQATAQLTEALALGESMHELQRISPPLWGLAETALLQGDHATSVSLCDKGFAASSDVADAAYLFPFLLTGTRARLALDDVPAATDWVVRVEAALLHRGIPGTLPAMTHARGLLALATGDRDAARASLATAAKDWARLERFWEGSWAVLDQARNAMAARQHAVGVQLADAVRNRARGVGASTLQAAAEALLSPGAQVNGAKPFHPLTAREWSVACLIVTGMTNREIAEELFVSPKTVSSHVEHILAKLGAGRRAEIAAWATKIDA